MITIRNPEECQIRTVVAGEALTVGQCVYIAQGTAKGEPPQVLAASATETGDPAIVKGVVAWVPDNSDAVDFIIDTVQALTLNAGSDGTTSIPSGALCLFVYDKPVIGFHSSAVDASLTFASVREADQMAFLGTTALLTDYNGGQTDGTEDFMGVVYQHEGAEITVMFTNL